MRTLIEIDLAQAEWIVTAYCAKDAQMIKVVEDGLDPHRHTGHLISGAPYDIIDKDTIAIGHATDTATVGQIRQETFDKQTLKDYFFPRIYSIRQAGKKSNHGLNYNMKPRRFSLENEMPESDGIRIVKGYHDGYVGLRQFYYPWIEDTLKEKRTLENCFGEKFRFLDVITEDLLNAAYSCLPQSTVARICLQALDNIYHDKYGVFNKTFPRANVHDSLIFDVIFDSWSELGEVIYIADELFDVPLQYHGRTFTLKRDIKIGPAWGEDFMTEVKKTGHMAFDLESAWNLGEQKRGKKKYYGRPASRFFPHFLSSFLFLK